MDTYNVGDTVEIHENQVAVYSSPYTAWQHYSPQFILSPGVYTIIEIINGMLLVTKTDRGGYWINPNSLNY